MVWISYSIPKEYRSVRAFLKEKRYPRAILAALKENPKGLCINGGSAKLSDPVSVGDRVDAAIIETVSASDQIVPREGPLDVVFEDEHLLVVNKTHHMAIHPSLHHRDMSLANIVSAHARKRHESYPFRCINRLDRDTTGLVIIAKNRLAASILTQDIAQRRIHREYSAVCRGIFEQKEGVVDMPIGRVEGSVILREVNEERGQRAVTRYRVLDESETHSLVSLVLETGRCHQIRVHMGYLGHPLPADYLYCEDYSSYASIPLHAGKIEFTHPITGDEMFFSTEQPFVLI